MPSQHASGRAFSQPPSLLPTQLSVMPPSEVTISPRPMLIPSGLMLADADVQPAHVLSELIEYCARKLRVVVCDVPGSIQALEAIDDGFDWFISQSVQR